MISQILRNQFKSEMAFKCPCCRIVSKTNIDFMKHISGHAQMPDASARDLVWFEMKYLLKYVIGIFRKTFTAIKNVRSFNVLLPYFCQVDILQCNYCLKSFDSVDQHRLHLDSKHLLSNCQFVCKYVKFVETCSVIVHKFWNHFVPDYVQKTFQNKNVWLLTWEWVTSVQRPLTSALLADSDPILIRNYWIIFSR